MRHPDRGSSRFRAASRVSQLLTWWLDNDMPYPPDGIDEMFQELTRYVMIESRVLPSWGTNLILA